MAEHYRFEGTVALVTGAASGIGAALAVDLARRGCRLVLVDRDEAGLKATATAVGRDPATHVVDLADPAAIAALPDAVEARFGRLDILVNNAGVALGGRFDETHLDDFEWLMDINLRAVVRMCHAFLPLLLRAPQGQIVNLSSVFGLVAPPGQVAYATSKFAVRGFSESLRHEYAGSPLGVTVVHPGGVSTAIARSSRGPRASGTPEEQAEHNRIVEKGRADFQKLLRLSPERAAAIIGDAIKARAPRVLVGSDAKQAAFIQRLMPTGYWAMIQRLSRRSA